MSLIQIADDQNTDTSIVRLVGKGEDPLIPLFTYLISESETHRFFLQVATANRNLSRFSPNPFDSISLSQMLSLVENRGYSRDAIVANITYYDAKIEALIGEEGSPETPFIRPTTGAINRPARTEEIVRCLELPQGHDNDFRIGKLARSGESEVAINADGRILNHHILIAGSTGSGKSHLLSNLAHAAAAMGRAIILFDHKPDHQNHHELNPDPNTQFPQAFSLNGQDSNQHPIRYYTLDAYDPNTHSHLLSVRAQDLDPEILAGTIFYKPNEDNQAEIFAHIATNYAANRAESGQEWTIQQLIQYIRSTNDNQLRTELYGDNGPRLNTNTMGALRRRIDMPSRIPSFIDPTPPSDALGHRRETANIDTIFRPWT